MFNTAKQNNEPVRDSISCSALALLRLSTTPTYKREDKMNVSSNCLSEQWILEVDWKQKGLNLMPEFNQKYQFCTVLNLSRNNLVDDVDWLIHLKRLEVLDLSENKLSKIADVCGSTATLQYLNLSCNCFEELPEWILFLEKVRTLNLSYNPLHGTFHLHLKKAKWRNVQICHLENLNLMSVPECLLSSNSLKELYLGDSKICPLQKDVICKHNALWKAPTFLPPTLVVLDLSYINLSNLDCDWKSLINLKELRTRGNDVSWPPEDFVNLKNLEICDLSSSQIVLLPKDFGLLTNLSAVNLSFNKVAVLPHSFEQLHSLKYLDIYNAGIEVIECSLINLPSLAKCDLWMNFVDPEEFLPNHSKLCENLRRCLPACEGDSRLHEQDRPIMASEDSATENSRSDEDEEKMKAFYDELLDNDNLHEKTAASTGTGVEESWDDEYSDEERDLSKSSELMRSDKQCNVDQHFFLPSELHASPCRLPPHQFNV